MDAWFHPKQISKPIPSPLAWMHQIQTKDNEVAWSRQTALSECWHAVLSVREALSVAQLSFSHQLIEFVI
jgi:hypothetical protein